MDMKKPSTWFGGKKSKNDYAAAETGSGETTAQGSSSNPFEASVEYGLDTPDEEDEEDEGEVVTAPPEQTQRKRDPWAIFTILLILLVAASLSFVAYRQETSPDEPVFHFGGASSDDFNEGENTTPPQDDATDEGSLGLPPQSNNSDAGNNGSVAYPQIPPVSEHNNSDTTDNLEQIKNNTTDTGDLPPIFNSFPTFPPSSERNASNSTLQDNSTALQTGDTANNGNKIPSTTPSALPTLKQSTPSPFSSPTNDGSKTTSTTPSALPTLNRSMPSSSPSGITEKPSTASSAPPTSESVTSQPASGSNSSDVGIDFCGITPPSNPLDKENNEEDEYDTLRATIGRYPGSTVETDPEGQVTMTFDNGDIIIALSINGVSEDCSDDNEHNNGACTVQIFNGRSCENSDLITFPWWNGAIFGASNPWLEVAYTSNDGNSEFTSNSEIMMTDGNGYDVKTNEGHTVIIHDSSGNRIACGILQNCKAGCPNDVCSCGDGYFSGRDRCNNCEYRPCET
mmetsp:Transcript_5837/g.8400  ORF Transcript_5837/g.8400 Transcript_5837/m.8400 type:complete len:511 (+) Transcript_5837:176-1708(+)